jgi:hypothetical protein
VAITNGNLIDYIVANRLFVEDGEYLLQEKIASLGHDAVGSARAWIWGRFYQSGTIDTLTGFTEATFGNLVVGDLAELATVRAAYDAQGVDSDLFMAIFEALIQLSIANLWQASGLVESGAHLLKEAKEMILAIVGNAADPDSGNGGGVGSDNLEAVFEIDVMSESEITDYLGGYE